MPATSRDSLSTSDFPNKKIKKKIHTKYASKKKGSDIEKAIHQGKQFQGIQGIAIIMGKQIGLWGGLKLVRLT